ncbi:hypothetical protein [Sphingobacterium wenxiniae]|uniref:DUF1735 domain-containing protein n=1 Tax=Sphingobacterium wenxiniae TaxID=683125 RepID=A0A1I6RB12_9SPHI|nr:hypothetical protein [Sphingobacterium wenxiniae]SFS61937.1 hypothetical protein SAMN05660206_103310 [Sphingobacterium wenxiniae]
MKRVYIHIVGALALAFGLSSCDKTDGTLYPGEPNKVSFFNVSTSLTMEGGSISVPVGRTSTSGELSVPVTISAAGAGYTDIFKMDGPVVFANGEAKSYAKVNYGDFSKIDPSALSVTLSGTDVIAGLAFPISLNIPDESLSPSNRKKVDVLASSILNFGAAATAQLNSEEGWMGDTYGVEVAKSEGANVYKVIKPFGYTSFAFMIKSDGETIVCPNQIIDNHPSYGPVSMTSVTGKLVDGVVTLNVGAYTVSAGSFGGGVEIIKLP